MNGQQVQGGSGRGAGKWSGRFADGSQLSGGRRLLRVDFAAAGFALHVAQPCSEALGIFAFVDVVRCEELFSGGEKRIAYYKA
jgi:hypothetical protein